MARQFVVPCSIDSYEEIIAWTSINYKAIQKLFAIHLFFIIKYTANHGQLLRKTINGLYRFER